MEKVYSWEKYTDRRNEYEDEFNIECDEYGNCIEVGSYGLLENLTICNCMSVEDVYNNVIWEE